ncbi:ABC transporter ATP-binding protein [Phytoactinopolyspora mesophila]|uniref:ABC transporter ATP-binding protein n=1 Tax=Phytoactinopolyspora mesophila TaxID=2650750 RepID=UPI001C9E5676
MQALDGLNLAVSRGEMVAIVGQTGCGKSTAFNLLLGLFAASSGTVSVQGMDPHGDFEALKGRIAVVFQDGRLLPWRNAQDNVALGLEYQGVSKSDRAAIARDWLARLGLEGREKAYPYELSGGMRQRVGIARCFALNPDIILCDESFSALDELTAERLRGEFLRLVKDEGKTGVFITHSIEEALTVGDRVAVFRAPGHVAAEFERPETLSEADLSRMRKSVRDVMATHPSP